MNNQIELMGYKTKNFDISREALETFTYLKSVLTNISEVSRKDILKALKYQDAMFGIEKFIKNIGIESLKDPQIEEALMLSQLVTYSAGLVAAELDLELIDLFS